MNHTLVVSHLKGGVGKTSTAINLCGGLALYKKKVLLIDLDPQGNASSALGFSHKNFTREQSNQSLIGISEVLLGRVPIQAAIYPYSPLPNLYVCPSNPLLVGLPQELLYLTNPNIILREVMHSIREEYDYIVLDCPPTLNILTINALCAAKEIVIPLQPEFFAMEGLQSLFEAIELTQKNLNPHLKIGGILFNMINSSALCQEICHEVELHFSEYIFSTRIPRTVKISEAQSHERTIQLYAPHIQASKAYNQLAREIIHKHNLRKHKEKTWVDPSLGEA